MFKKSFFVLVIIIFFTCVSCRDVSGRLLILEANYHSSAGRYMRAISSYQKALAYNDAAPYAQAGLGSVYYQLEETKAALNRFDESRDLLDRLSPAGHTELRYRNSYNSGIAMFAQGDFSSAAAAFRAALHISPERIEAKRNLELCLLSIASDKTNSTDTPHTSAESDSKNVLFDYLIRKEQNLWRSLEWAAEEQTDGPDY